VTKVLTDYQSAAQRAVQNVPSTQLTSTDWVAFVAEAMRDYSFYCPYLKRKAVTGTGTHYYKITSTDFPSWVEGFSTITEIIYPAPTISDDEETPRLYESDEYELYSDGTDWYLHFFNESPGSTEAFLVTYTIVHTIGGLESASTNATTIPDIHFEAVVWRAAAAACFSLASRYAQSQDATYTADIVNYGNVADQLRRLGTQYETMYRKRLGITDAGVSPIAYGTFDRDSKFGGGRSYLTHKEEGR